jgi:hypothetical protein
MQHQPNNLVDKDNNTQRMCLRIPVHMKVLCDTTKERKAINPTKTLQEVKPHDKPLKKIHILGVLQCLMLHVTNKQSRLNGFFVGHASGTEM